MITKEQCRAARSFLGMKQIELAELSGLSKTAITHFESGLFHPRAENMSNIKAALESRGIDFIGLNGVQRRETAFRVMEGDDMYQEVWDDIFDTLKETGGEVLISYVDDGQIFKEHPEKLEAHLKRLDKHNITERLLSCEGDDVFIQSKECYRWLPEEVFKAGIMTLIYGEKVAFQFWNHSTALVVKNKKIKDEEKQRFEYLWENAIIPP